MDLCGRYTRGVRPEVYLWAILDRGILHRQHVHVTPATFAALAALGLAAAVVGHELVYGFASDRGGQVSGHLTRGEVLTALHISQRVPGACTSAPLVGCNNLLRTMSVVEQKKPALTGDVKGV